MKIGLYGGSFDPVHCGHIEPILVAKRQLGLDRVIYLPTAEPPHKPDRSMAPAHARFAMVELALLDQPDLFVSAFELTPGRPAFSVDSAEQFAAEYPGAKLFLILGGDSYRQLDTWHRWRDLVEICAPAILVRPGWELERVVNGLHPELAALMTDGGATFVENPAVDVSSTHVRDLFSRRDPVPPEMMPPLVVEYVEKYQLYS